MKYFLQRDGRTYGPYSYDDLKRYQSENRIGPNDLIRREDSQQWDPWQQVLNPVPAVPEVPPMEQPPAFGRGGFDAPVGQPPQQPGFGQTPPAFGGGTTPPFGQTPPAPFGGGAFGQPPAGQGFPPQQPPADAGFGAFGQPPQQQPQASDVPGAFGAFGAQGGFGGQPQFGQPQGAMGGYGGGAVGPMPPDMQWWLVFIITFFCGLFGLFWLWKQVMFVKKIDPQCEAPKFYGMGFALIIGGYVVTLLASLMATTMGSEVGMVFPLLGMLVVFGGAVCVIMGAFKMRDSIHNYYTTVEPMGINLMDTTGTVLTLFFAVYFFQYHFANIAMRKKAMGHPSA